MRKLFLLLVIIQSLTAFSEKKDSTYSITGLYKIVKIKKYKKFNIITIADTNNNILKTPIITKRHKFKCSKIKKNEFYKLSLIKYYEINDTVYYIGDCYRSFNITPMIAGSQCFWGKANIFVTPNIQGLCYQKNEIIATKTKNNISKIKKQVYRFFYSIYKTNDTLLYSLIDAKKMKKSILWYNKKINSAPSLVKLLYRRILYDMLKPKTENIEIVFLNIQDNIYTVRAIIKDKTSTYESVLSVLVKDNDTKIIGIDLYYNLSNSAQNYK